MTRPLPICNNKNMITTPLNAKMFNNLADALHHYNITPVNREAWHEINHWHPDLNHYQEYYKLYHNVSIDSLLDCYKFELGNLDRNFVVIQGGLGYDDSNCCMVLELPMPTKAPECYRAEWVLGKIGDSDFVVTEVGCGGIISFATGLEPRPQILDKTTTNKE